MLYLSGGVSKIQKLKKVCIQKLLPGSEIGVPFCQQWNMSSQGKGSGQKSSGESPQRNPSPPPLPGFSRGSEKTAFFHFLGVFFCPLGLAPVRTSPHWKLLDDLIIKMYNGKVGINVEAANTELRLVQAPASGGGRGQGGGQDSHLAWPCSGPGGVCFGSLALL